MKYTLEAHLEPVDGPMEFLDAPVTVYEGSVEIDLPGVGVLSIPVEEFRCLAAVVEHESPERTEAPTPPDWRADLQVGR